MPPATPETPPKQDNLHKELDLIQAVVTRLAQNSFLIKGWSITLVSIVLALGKDDLLTNARPGWLVGLVLVIWAAFWYLDAYFLRQERLFRKLYEHVVANPDDPARPRYSLNVGVFEKKVESEIDTMFSITLGVFYGIPALLLAGIWFYFLLFC